MTGESTSFRLIPANQKNRQPTPNGSTGNKRTKLIVVAHGFADAGVNKEGVAQFFEDSNWSGAAQAQTFETDSPAKNGFFNLNPRTRFAHAKQDFRERRRAGISGLLTPLVGYLAIGLTEQDSDISAIDVVSPSFTRDKKWLPENATLLTGGTEGRGFELLGSVLDWLEEKQNKETGQFEAPDEIIIAGHSLGAPTVSSFFEALATASVDDPRIGEERRESLKAARTMFLDEHNSSQVNVQLIDPGIDPQHSLLLPQRIKDNDDGSSRRKKTIIFPLLRAVGGGVVEQTSQIMQSDMSVSRKISRLLFRLPQLANVIRYSLRLPAVLHEAGPVVSSSSLHGFAEMTRLVDKSNSGRNTTKNRSSVNVIFHEKDQIFPAESMERQLKDSGGVYSIQKSLPEERGLHQAKHAVKYVRDVWSNTKEAGTTVDRKRTRARQVAKLALRAAIDFRLDAKMPQPYTSHHGGSEYFVNIIPDGSHTSVGLKDDAKRVSESILSAHTKSTA